MRDTDRVMQVLLVLALYATAHLCATESDDIRRVYERHLAQAMVGSEKADSQVPGILKLLDAHGRYTDLNYKYKTRNKGEILRPHLLRTQLLAQAWARPGGRYRGKQEIRDKIVLALNGWLDENPKDRNWWWRIIGWPRMAWQAPMIMRNELEKNDPALLKAWTDYLLHSRTKSGGTGANATDVQKVLLAAGALAGRYDIMKATLDKTRKAFRVVGKRKAGTYSDGSFAQHNSGGRQLYFGGYGHAYVDGFLTPCQLVKDTNLGLSDENFQMIEDFFLKGLRHVTYGPHYLDILVHGRSYGRGESVPVSTSYAGPLKALIAVGSPRKKELQGLYARLSDEKGATQPTANTMFWHADFMTHSRQHYYTSVRGTSTRTVGNESGNGEGLLNYHMGDGVNMVLHHGDEYREILPIWNWRKLPGTTVEQQEGKLPLVDWGKGAAGGNDFAGGVSDGRYGAYAFIFNEGGANTNVDAFKATFFFDDEYVALGAGVEAPNAKHAVVTTINQTLHKGPFWVGTKRSETKHESGTVTLSAGDWVSHYDTGYVLLDFAGEASTWTAKQTGNWKALYSSKSSNPVSGSVFHISIDHGKPVTESSHYAYAVVPGRASSAMASYVSQLPVQVLANTPTAQGVRHTGLQVTSIIFYQAGSVELGEGKLITSDKPACVMLRNDGDDIHLSVATPLYRKETVTVTLPMLLTGDNVAADKARKQSTVLVQLSDGHDAGRTVTTVLKRLR